MASSHRAILLSFNLATAVIGALLISPCAIAGPRSCGEERNLKSAMHDQTVEIEFSNRLQEPAYLFWLDYQGKSQIISTIAPGATVHEKTYATHPWVLADGQGRCLAAIVADTQASQFDLTPETRTAASYDELEIEGWQVKINQDVRRFDPALADKALSVLKTEFQNIRQAVPPRHVAELQKVGFWLEYDDGPTPGLAYHLDYGGMRQSGKPPSKIHSVEITSAADFVSSVTWEPWVVLHELSHAYHQQVLGLDDPTIRAAYANAVSHHLYEKVRHYDGKLVRAYALTNEREYFAELTEAYFGRNDFYPFTRDELAAYDPVGFAMVRHLWEER